MNKKGVTLIELLVVIVVMSILTAITVNYVGNIISNTRESVDDYNQQFLVDTLEDLFVQGTIEMKGNKILNNETGKTYSGTGRTFYNDLDGYFANRIFPLVEEAQNKHNQTGDGIYRYRFRQKNGNLEIYYFDESKSVVVVAVVEIP